MIPYHALFRTRSDAEAAASAGEDRLAAQLLAAAQAALPSEKQGDAGSSPVIKGRLISATPIAHGAQPASGVEYSEAVFEITTPSGEIEQVISRIPTSQLPPPTKTNGIAIVGSTVSPTITLTATIAKKVQVIATATGTYSTGSLMQDLVTGKLYQVDGDQAYAIGVTNIDVVETSSSDLSEVNHGSTFLLLSPPSNMMPTGRVIQMKNTSITSGKNLTDVSTGKKYVTTTGLTFASSPMLTGSTTGTVNFERVTSDLVNPTDGLDKQSATVGTVFTFDTAVAGTSTSATVATSVTVTIPKDSTLTVGTKNYVVTADATIYDNLAGFFEYIATVASATANLTAGNTMTFSPAVTNVGTSATVVTANGAIVYPVPFVSEVFGGQMTLVSSVREEIYGGQWSATLQVQTEAT